MATRGEIDKKRVAMTEALRRACSTGQMMPGEALPPIRHLADAHGVSVKVACQAVQSLVDDGILNSVPRIGIFVARPSRQLEAYALVGYEGTGTDFTNLIQMGFEERIAQLGGLSVRLGEAEALEFHHKSPWAGVFRMSVHRSPASLWPAAVPMVEFGTHNHREDSDIVRFDDRAGGRIATGHLLSMGHERIAFLGHHTREPRPTNYFWSVEREIGWMESMRAAGRATEGLSFLPEASERWPFEKILTGPEQCGLAYEVARDSLLPRRDITAVVAANVIAAEGLYSALAESDVPEADWPAVVCFDDVTSGSRSVITCVRLPWDEVGRAAAQLLWDRNHGQEAAPPRQILVPMRLIARLTCRPDKSSHLMIASGSQLLTGALS